MNATAETATYADRYHQLATQHAYSRRIAAFGLPAILAPYARPVQIVRSVA